MLLFILVILACSHLCNSAVDIKDFFIDVEPILNQLDDVIANNSMLSSELLDLCSKVLVTGSLILSDKWKAALNDDAYVMYMKQFKLYRFKSEEIVRKLKQLPSKPEGSEEGFFRDIFEVKSNERNAEYLIVAREYYSEVQFYTNSNDMMKLCEWKVYKLTSPLGFDLTDEDIQTRKYIAHYNLEKSHDEDGTPTYMFGRTDIEDGGHVSIANYGTNPGSGLDGYYQMKLLVIQDLQSLKGLPVLARTIRNREIGINTAIVYGSTRRIQQILGLEVDDDMLYDDDTVMMFDTKTRRKIGKSDL